MCRFTRVSLPAELLGDLLGKDSSALSRLVSDQMLADARRGFTAAQGFADIPVELPAAPDDPDSELQQQLETQQSTVKVLTAHLLDRKFFTSFDTFEARPDSIHALLAVYDKNRAEWYEVHFVVIVWCPVKSRWDIVGRPVAANCVPAIEPRMGWVPTLEDAIKILTEITV